MADKNDRSSESPKGQDQLGGQNTQDRNRGMGQQQSDSGNQQNRRNIGGYGGDQGTERGSGISGINDFERAPAPRNQDQGDQNQNMDRDKSGQDKSGQDKLGPNKGNVKRDQY